MENIVAYRCKLQAVEDSLKQLQKPKKTVLDMQLGVK